MPIASVGLGIWYSHEVAPLSADPSILRFIFGFAGILFVTSYIMASNDYFDAEIDKQKGDKYALGEIPKGLAIAIVIILLFFGLLFAFLVSPIYFSIILIMVLLSTAYSAPPIRFKEVYPFSTLGEISGAYLLFLAGCVIVAPISINALIISLIPCLAKARQRLGHELYFDKFDRETGKKTLAVVHGVGTVRLLRRLCIFIILALILVLLYTQWISLNFLFFLVILVLGSMAPKPPPINIIWGFGYFFIIIAMILFS